jgi:uncharacterized membrane protein YraQ (UPF0718 family)
MRIKFPILLSILAMIGGVFISILFGANEGMFKDRILKGLEQNVKIQSIQDPGVKAEKMKSEQDKNWRYYQRYHFHATGISSLSLVILLLLAFVQGHKFETTVASYLVALGGFFYPFVWLFAGLYGPQMGREEAKEAFAIFGYMGGVFLVGIIYSLVLATIRPWKEPFAKST